VHVVLHDFGEKMQDIGRGMKIVGPVLLKDSGRGLREEDTPKCGRHGLHNAATSFVISNMSQLSDRSFMLCSTFG
jgi:hypothetical protein